MKKKILFITYKGHVKYDHPGGVQICTKEYIDLLEACNLQVILFEIGLTKNLFKRVKARLNINFYDKFDFKKNMFKLTNVINSENIKYVALNTVDMTAYSKYFKKVFENKVKIILLSHGNETGDLLQEIILTKQNIFCRYLNKYRLGALLYKESFYRNSYIDTVFCISELEVSIEKWLGAKEVEFIPRTYKKKIVEWAPKHKVIGYVGTLDHYPNFHGLSAFLNEIRDTEIVLRIIGGPLSSVNQLKNIYPNIEYLGNLSDIEMIKEISSWSIFIHPIFYFARGASTKLSTAINSGLPIATTKFGIRGYNIPEKNLIIRDTPKELADSVTKILNNRDDLFELKQKAELIADQGEDINDIAKRISKYLL